MGIPREEYGPAIKVRAGRGGTCLRIVTWYTEQPLKEFSSATRAEWGTAKYAVRLRRAGQGGRRGCSLSVCARSRRITGHEPGTTRASRGGWAGCAAPPWADRSLPPPRNSAAPAQYAPRHPPPARARRLWWETCG